LFYGLVRQLVCLPLNGTGWDIELDNLIWLGSSRLILSGFRRDEPKRDGPTRFAIPTKFFCQLLLHWSSKNWSWFTVKKKNVLKIYAIRPNVMQNIFFVLFWKGQTFQPNTVSYDSHNSPSFFFSSYLLYILSMFGLLGNKLHSANNTTRILFWITFIVNWGIF